MKTKIAIAIVSSFAIFQASLLLAAPGDLDPTFAGTGKSRIGFSGGRQFCYGAAVQADGKLVLAGTGVPDRPLNDSGGEFEVVRFDTNNVLDASFGVGGAAITPFNDTNLSLQGAVAQAVKIQADGKIIAAGYAQATNAAVGGFDSYFALARYNPDGSLDSSFGTGGKVVTGFGVSSRILALAILADGNILAAGYAGTNFALARYETNGVLDASFGSGGVVTTDVGDNDPDYLGRGAGYGIALLVHGNYVVVGSGLNGAVLAVLRYTTNGVLDLTWGGTGKVFTSIPGYAGAAATAVGFQLGNGTFLHPGNIVVGGRADSAAGSVFVVARYNLDGTLDTTFDGTGIVTGTFGTSELSDNDVAAVLVQGSLSQPRKITIAGTGYDSSATSVYFAMARYNGDGTPDTAFGSGGTGKATLSFGPAQEDLAKAMTVQAGKIVLAGSSLINNNPFSSYNWDWDFAAARFNSDGSLDTAFGSNGVVTADVCGSSSAGAVAVQTDDKVVVAGQDHNYQVFATLARYNPDGTVDTSFGMDGRVTTEALSAAYAVALQPDGKIVAVGPSSSAFGLARYHANGTPDASFGTNGISTAQLGELGNSSLARAVKIQADGKILAAGYAFDASGYPHFGLARFNPNGTLDVSFGNSGKVITSFGSSHSDDAYGLEIQRDGKIVVAGYTEYLNGPYYESDFAVARYDTNGFADVSFGSLGQITAHIGIESYDIGYAMTLQPDGKIIVAGQAGTDLALLRFNTNGVLDPTFGTGGIVTTPLGVSALANAVALQSDGKILVAGNSAANYSQTTKFLAQRYNADGSLDPSYGNNGSQIVDFGTYTGENAYGLALDSSGRAVLAGDAGGLFGVARLLGDALPGIPLTISLTATNTAVVSWPHPSAGWNLLENSDLSTTNWATPAETINNDGTNNFIIVNPPSAKRFYRLFKP